MIPRQARASKLSDKLRKKRPAVSSVYQRPHAYGSTFVAQAKAVKQRDGHRCRKCGWQPPKKFRWLLHAHHKLERLKGGRDTGANLDTICAECHIRVHPNNKAFAENMKNVIAVVRKIKKSQGFKPYG